MLIGENADRYERIAQMAYDPAHSEAGASFREADGPRLGSPSFNEAMRTMELHHDQGALRSESARRLEDTLRRADPVGLGARYVAAVGSEHYLSAFGKMVQDPTNAHLRFEPDEVEAVRNVSRIEAERALAVGSDPTGGFAVPFTLDPSIVLSSDGTLNPVRQLARVESITGDEWHGVSSAGVDAHYYAEAAEVSDDSPTLAGPYRFAGGGSSEPQLLPDRGGPLLGKRTVEWSSIGTGATGGTKLAVYADWRQMFLICDRIGTTVELIPHLLGSAMRPMGQTSMFMYWRTGSVLVKEAGRYLEVT